MGSTSMDRARSKSLRCRQTRWCKASRGASAPLSALAQALLKQFQPFVVSSTPSAVTPVRFASGRRRLVTRPPEIGSPVVTNTTGISLVSFFTASAPGFEPVTITSTLSATSSAASLDNRSPSPSAKRVSRVKLCPSLQPRSFRPARRASIMGRSASRDSGDNLAIRVVRGCCANVRVGSPGPWLPPNSGIPAASFDHLVGAR